MTQDSARDGWRQWPDDGRPGEEDRIETLFEDGSGGLGVAGTWDWSDPTWRFRWRFAADQQGELLEECAAVLWATLQPCCAGGDEFKCGRPYATETDGAFSSPCCTARALLSRLEPKR